MAEKKEKNGQGTSTNEGRTDKCLYKKCMLPNHNGYYFFQIVYLIICCCFIFCDNQSITYIPILMYIVPVLFDMFFSKLRYWAVKPFVYILAALNIAILIFCILGLKGIVVDGGNVFILRNALLPKGTMAIQKKWIIYALLTQILVPICLFFGSPTQWTERIANQAGGTQN